MNSTRPGRGRLAPTLAISVVAVIAAPLLLTGCGTGERGASSAREAPPSPSASSAPGSTTPRPSTPAATTPAPSTGTRTGTPGAEPPMDLTPLPPKGRPKGPGDSRATLSLVGRVRPGVEGGCLVIESNQGVFTLLPGESDAGTLKPGQRVLVTGRVEEGGFSTCQEGRLLRVLSARRS